MSVEIERALKKQRLVLKSSDLRQRLADDSQPLQPLFAAADKVTDGIHWIQARPGIALAATAVLVVLRPRPLLRWGRRAFFAWKTWRTLQNRLNH